MIDRLRRENPRRSSRLVAVVSAAIAAVSAADQTYRSPVAISADKDAGAIYVAEATANSVAVINAADGLVARRIALPESPGGLAISPDGKTLYVTNAAPSGCVRLVDAATGRIRGAVSVGHTPMAPVVSPDGAVLYVCNRFSNDVSIVDTARKTEVKRIPAVREPVAATLTPDGTLLFVANLLPEGPADGDFVAAAVTVIDTVTRLNAGTIVLPNGSIGVRGIGISPDGAYVYAVHALARYHVPQAMLDRGWRWMNTYALSVINVRKKRLMNTVLLDDANLSAANPWAVACTADGRYICVAHAGTHELSVIDREALHVRLDRIAAGERVTEVSGSPENVPNDFWFLDGLHRRIRLPGNGPRALLIIGTTIYAAEYFSDSLSVIDVSDEATPNVRTIALGPRIPLSPARKGEMLFNDATLCLSQWQSCATCHPDARADGINWDLMNDGTANPKNTKSMLLAHKTPPAMSLGVRETAETAVRAGIKHILFAVRPETDAAATDEYLKSLKPVPSPRLSNGKLNPAAKRGKGVFVRAGCSACHPEPLYTDLKSYIVGTGKGPDSGRAFDTPTLVEVWRTAPYLHDGRAANLVDVLTKYNPNDKHGTTTNLRPEEIQELAEFVLSL